MAVAYNPSLEIDPKKFLLVVGPHFTAAVLNEITKESADQSTLALSSWQLVTVGIHLLLETAEFQSDAEKAKCDTLYRNAYELDPLFAVKKLSSSLQKNGKYAEWLRRAFDVDLVPSDESPSLEKVRQLQQEGALVVYTHYDDILCRVTKTKPILLNDLDSFERWRRGESEGFLHVHGVYSELDTVVFDSEAYHAPNHPFKSAASQLSAVFSERHLLMIGADSETHCEDPLLLKFVERYMAVTSPNLHTFHLTRAENPPDLNCVHKVAVQETPVSTLVPLSNTSQALWRQLELPRTCPKSLTFGLLCGKKEEATEISRMIADGPGVTFALMSSFTFNSQATYTVSLKVVKSKEKELWEWLVHQQRDQLLTKGLLAVVLHSGTFLWMKRKPYSDLEEYPTDSSDPPPLIKTTQLLTSSARSTDCVDKSFPPFKPKEEPLSPDLSFPKRKVPRYTMHQIRPRHQPYPGAGSMLGKYGRPDVPLFGQHNNRALTERRASLPVNSMHNTSAHALEQLAHNLSPAQSHDLPSYAAIKQALLCDWYKRRRSIQADPKKLKGLLKSKLMPEPLDLLKLRRYSDPGSISQPESFVRRKELFIDENRTWSFTYGKVIEQKIAKWKMQREEKRRREMLEFAGLKYHLLNPLQSNGVPPNGAQMFPSGLATTGLGSYAYPPTIIAPVNGAAQGSPQSSMLYSPYIAPYTMLSPYQPFMQVGQPTALYLPQPTTMPSQQKVVYLVPPGTAATTTPSSYTTLNGSSQHLKVDGSMLTRKRSDSTLTDNDDQQVQDLYKRRQSVSVNLSSLLVSPLSQLRPESPPPAKRVLLSEEPSYAHTPPTPHMNAQQQTSKQHSQLSSRQHHLLQIHRKRNGENGQCRSASPSPLASPRNCSPTHYQNGYYSGSDGSDIDELEAEKIVGGAVMSPNQPGLAAPSRHNKLQLWQFLLELLLISANTRLIQWSNNNFEFQVNNPSGVAELWGKVTNNNSMNYPQLLKGLRYYFSKGIMSKVEGKQNSFKYNSCIQSYIEMRRSSIANHQEELVVVE